MTMIKDIVDVRILTALVRSETRKLHLFALVCGIFGTHIPLMPLIFTLGFNH
jgi:hypothetical protein